LSWSESYEATDAYTYLYYDDTCYSMYALAGRIFATSRGQSDTRPDCTTLGVSVYLDNTPQGVLDSVDPSALADYVLPGYHLPGHGLVNCCLRCPAGQPQQSSPDVSVLFFESLTALRLRAPLSIEVAGQFRLGSNDDLIQEPTLYQVFSPWQPVATARYTTADIASANDIAIRFRQVSESSYHKLKSATVLFAQVTCGHSKSLQMAYLALFAALEALFTPRGNYASTLACRISTYLQPFSFPGSLRDWLEEEYRTGRNNIAHGVQNIAPRITAQGNGTEVFGKLHEITRLSILGFLSLDEQKLAAHSTATGTELQNMLNSLGQARGRFVDDQQYWFPGTLAQS
jgi:hypothetical protein